MWFPFWKKKKDAPTLSLGQWILVPLGNPGGEYTCTRHNLGRLMLQRWMDEQCLKPDVIRSFYYGTIYSLKHPVIALAPSTYMNLSGKAVAEAVRNGFPAERMLVIYDDKDLPLGTGRLSKNGSSAGHNGLQSIIDEIGNDTILRLRLGIAPFQRPLREWVLGEWSPDEWNIIENMDSVFSKFISALANTTTIGDLQSRVNDCSFWQL
ncbi:MAG: aminoacyl-tRNA hydrolase [Holophagales bacterium]|jgi:PTH1 family peptidyl-tRNA hydrolase|nr:aminoacyl-tRNA hydrolase [Holophagales bacterium]